MAVLFPPPGFFGATAASMAGNAAASVAPLKPPPPPKGFWGRTTQKITTQAKAATPGFWSQLGSNLTNVLSGFAQGVQVRTTPAVAPGSVQPVNPPMSSPVYQTQIPPTSNIRYFPSREYQAPGGGATRPVAGWGAWMPIAIAGGLVLLVMRRKK